MHDSSPILKSLGKGCFGGRLGPGISHCMPSTLLVCTCTAGGATGCVRGVGGCVEGARGAGTTGVVVALMVLHQPYLSMPYMKLII